jgi:hypothetical protein
MDTRQYAECGGCGRLYNTSKDNEIVEMDTHDCNATCKDCGHNKIECPSHEGNFDCNPFCALCEGEQEYCPTCEGGTECDHTNVEWVSGEVGVVISLNGDVFAICKDCGAEARSSEQPEE